MLIGLPMAMLTGAVYLGRHFRRTRGKRNPLTRSLLRAPGTSLKKALDATQDQMILIALSTTVLASYVAGLFMGSQSREATPGAYYWILVGASIVIGLAYAIRKLLKLQDTAYRQRLGLNGEMAVGEELNHLMAAGYRVFHDVPGPNYNVDHVVVGPNGVFAVETKSHPKIAGGFTAEFDGNAIRYPDRVDRKATVQAMRQANSVARYLTKACGNQIKVCAVVILPGWNVKQTRPTQGCVLMASGQIAREFPKLKCEALDVGQIQARSHQVEQLCRSESPMALSEADDLRFAQRPTL